MPPGASARLRLEIARGVLQALTVGYFHPKLITERFININV